MKMSRMTRRRRGAAVVGTAIAAVGAMAGPASAEIIYGVTSNGFLINWDSSAPGTILGGSAITGLLQNEIIVGIDFRPSTGVLYGLGSQGMVYTLDTVSAEATQGAAGALPIPLVGSAFGFDFDPSTDTIRVVSNADQNLQIDPVTGSMTGHAMLSYPMGDSGFTFDPNVVHLAYTGSPATLYGIDVGRDTLVSLANPVNGQLTTIATIPLDLTESGGFDFSPGTGTAYAAVLTADQSRSRFVTVNLASGAVSDMGEVGGGNVLTAIAVIPTPGTVSALVVLAAGAARRRR